jgi:hypothetical protein
MRWMTVLPIWILADKGGSSLENADATA